MTKFIIDLYNTSQKDNGIRPTQTPVKYVYILNQAKVSNQYFAAKYAGTTVTPGS
jgi:hypothetical protein